MLTKDKVEDVLKCHLTQYDTVRWYRGSLFCEIDIRISQHNIVLSFGFDEEGNLMPSLSSGPTLKTLAQYTAAFNRALAVIHTLGLILPE